MRTVARIRQTRLDAVPSCRDCAFSGVVRYRDPVVVARFCNERHNFVASFDWCARFAPSQGSEFVPVGLPSSWLVVASIRPGSLCNTRTHCNGCSK